jgi:hypothetical protein
MRGLDIIGAGESLAPYTIMVHVRKVDPAKLRATITDKPWGAAIPGAIQMVDSAPELALEVVLPIVKTQLEQIGITADITKTTSPPKGGKVGHEMQLVLGLGAVLGIGLAVVGGSLYHLIHKAK